MSVCIVRAGLTWCRCGGRHSWERWVVMLGVLLVPCSMLQCLTITPSCSPLATWMTAVRWVIIGV